MLSDVSEDSSSVLIPFSGELADAVQPVSGLGHIAAGWRLRKDATSPELDHERTSACSLRSQCSTTSAMQARASRLSSSSSAHSVTASNSSSASRSEQSVHDAIGVAFGGYGRLDMSRVLSGRPAATGEGFFLTLTLVRAARLFPSPGSPPLAFCPLPLRAGSGPDCALRLPGHLAGATGGHLLRGHARL